MQAVILGVACAAALAAMTAAPAQAWEKTIDGVRFGWYDLEGRQTEYAFAEASDATLAGLGASKVTGFACKAIVDDDPVLAWLCKEGVKVAVSRWIGTEGHSRYHGHRVRFYPHAQGGRHLFTGEW